MQLLYSPSIILSVETTKNSSFPSKLSASVIMEGAVLRGDSSISMEYLRS